jgi:hypothetical protein
MHISKIFNINRVILFNYSYITCNRFFNLFILDYTISGTT